jgi:hypothetical protein
MGDEEDPPLRSLRLAEKARNKAPESTEYSVGISGRKTLQLYPIRWMSDQKGKRFVLPLG